MRLDKFMTHTSTLSRSESAKAARQGRITVDGVACKDISYKINPQTSIVALDGKIIEYKKYCWIMLNKPAGVVSATEDGNDKTVIDLLPENLRSKGLFPCGRLDKDTVGLILLTDDGELAHMLLSPKNHAKKVYSFKLSVPYDKSVGIEKGIMMDGKLTKPAKIQMQDQLNGKITLTEGKYHQVKRMFERAGSSVVYLKRVSFGGVRLDENLPEGAWRYLTEDEEDALRKF